MKSDSREVVKSKMKRQDKNSKEERGRMSHKAFTSRTIHIECPLKFRHLEAKKTFAPFPATLCDTLIMVTNGCVIEHFIMR